MTYSEKKNSSDKVLFVDDEPAVIRSLSRGLLSKGAKFQILEANSVEKALEVAKLERPGVCVIDLSIDETKGPESGLSLLKDLLLQDSSTRVLVLTGHSSEEVGIKALYSGASSFLVKPASPEHLLPLIEDALSHSNLKRVQSKVKTNSDVFLGLKTSSKSMAKVFEQADFAASNKQPLLIYGETGTGKGLLARAIHQASSKGAFVRFQPSYGSQDLVSSELFGHVKGAFTGATEDRAGLIEQANNGSLFIDEVDFLPTETQVSLLEVLQERVFKKIGASKEISSNFRLITATNADLETALNDGKLRKDFYHRVAHLKIEIPALRNRAEDIPSLASSFVETIANTEKLPIHSIGEDALAKLSSYSWPGNVRELRAVVENACFRAAYENRGLIVAKDITLEESKLGSSNGASSFRELVKGYEVSLINSALEKAEGNQSKAAELLALDRSTLRRILARG